MLTGFDLVFGTFWRLGHPMRSIGADPRGNGKGNIWSRVFLGCGSSIQRDDGCSGYGGWIRRGGTLEHPTYKEVCTDKTGHAEVVQLTYDAARVSFEQLLDAFFALHDPTQLNRQGPDWGTQYRSAIFTHSAEQEMQARARIAELNAAGTFRRAIVTDVRPAVNFWKAEEYHQRYLEKRGMVSCHI